MTAIDNLKKIHTVDGATISNSYGPAIIHSEDVGCIHVRSENIVLGDPMVKYSLSDMNRKCFSQAVAPGVYSVLAYYANTENEKHIAFVEIRFSSKKPTRFVAAKSIIDTETKRRGFNGYPTHNGTTGFMDTDLYTRLCNLSRYKDGYSILREDDRNNSDVSITYDDALNPLAVRIHVPSSYYYWYWGKDSSGNICCLIGDFFTFA